MLLGSPITIDPASWLDWKKSPTTQEVFAALRRERDDWVKALVDGNTMITGREAIETAKAVGIIYGLDCLLEGVEAVLRDQWEERKDEG